MSAAFNRWLDTFVEEKGVDTAHTFTIDTPDGWTHVIDIATIIAHLKLTTDAEQVRIKDIAVRMDFRGVPVMRLFSGLAEAFAANPDNNPLARC